MSAKVCNPRSIREWNPKTNYQTFVMRADAADKLSRINKRVKKCCQDIDEIESLLFTLRNQMGNAGATGQINAIIRELEDKKYELIRGNSLLLSASNQVINYVQNNKQDKLSDANKISKDLSRIELYKG